LCSSATWIRSEIEAGKNLDCGFHVATHAGQLWRDARPDQREVLQVFAFPEGLAWMRAGFVRTPRTAMFFSDVGPVARPD